LVLAKAETATTARETTVHASVALHKSIAVEGGRVAALDALVTLPGRPYVESAELPSGWSNPAAKWSSKHQQVLWRMQPGTVIPGTRKALQASVPVSAPAAATAKQAAPIRVKTAITGVSICQVSVHAAAGCRIENSISAELIARF
jgi:hypothetical protein